MSNRVIVIGAGPAGLMAAGTAAGNSGDVLLLERNDKIGRKLMITGKGRCNVTNDAGGVTELISNIPQNGRFLYSAFSAFDSADTIRFFEDLSVPLKTERGNRVFPVSDKAVDIVDALNRYITDAGVKRKTERVTDIITENGFVRGVMTESGKIYESDRVIVATGGLSYPKTGSTGDGYRFAVSAGHTVTELRPSLSALICRERLCGECMGLSLKNVAISVKNTESKKQVYNDFGEMLFTHFGVSGPIILSASAHMRDMKPEKYEIYMDLKPALSEEKLDLRILRDFSENSNKSISNVLTLLLPKSIIPAILRTAHIDPAIKANQITKEMRKNLISVVKSLKLTVLDFNDISEAIVTSGGVKVSEINPKTMESKLCRGLYFAGEVIDCDGYTGGFNLQIAFSTGRLAGLNASAD
ncbi:MAG: NAD(P)/FAD-dependent oxidoreductase [Oscillospiraceae bacterium]|nr:NAD(P)/FAD-dependent oxidoreductase [Oscillospiraceae bacterium]